MVAWLLWFLARTAAINPAVSSTSAGRNMVTGLFGEVREVGLEEIREPFE